MIVGACCLNLLCRRLTLGPIESRLVSALFWTSPNVISGYISVWAQSASVFLIRPILLVAMIAAGMRGGWPRVVLAWLASFLAALLLIQDFYAAQFALLVTVLLLLGVGRAREGARGRRGRVACRGRGGAEGAAFVTPAPPVTLGRPSRAWLVVAGLAFVVSVIAFVHPIDRTAIGPSRFSVRDPVRPLIIACVVATCFVHRRWRLLPRVRPAIAAAAATGAPATGGAGAPGSAPIEHCHRDHDCLPRRQNFVGLPRTCTCAARHPSERKWRNWETHQLEGLAVGRP